MICVFFFTERHIASRVAVPRGRASLCGGHTTGWWSGSRYSTSLHSPARRASQTSVAKPRSGNFARLGRVQQSSPIADGSRHFAAVSSLPTAKNSQEASRGQGKNHITPLARISKIQTFLSNKVLIGTIFYQAFA